MDENGNKKRRIARIGRMSNGNKATKLSCDEGFNKIDRSLVCDIMESMDKSQNVMSYHQLQEFRSKNKSISTNNSVSSSSGKQNKISNSKQIKKFDSGKKYPLMAKCQQTMKNLKKNRSMPKPRAHVGPSQTPISRLQSNNLFNSQTVSNIIVNHKECPVKTSKNSKRNGCSPEVNDRPKKAKTAHSVDRSLDTNASQTKSFDKGPKFISDADSDSDNEFEQFIQKHHPETSVRRKTTKNNKFKKKRKQLVCAKKVAKVTSRTLSDSDESMESEVDHNIEINRKEMASKKFKKIIAYDDSDTDYLVNDTLNYDSSSEDENIVKKSLNKENAIDCNVNRLATLPDQRSSVISSSVSTHEPKDSPPYCDVLKSKCKIPCYVMLKRDPLLDKRAASLYVDNSRVSNTVSVSNSNKDDYIIILSETSIVNFVDQISKNNTPALKDKNSNERLILNSNNLEPQAEKNSKEKSTESLLNRRNAEKEASSVTALRKSLGDTEKDECHENENSIECTNKSVTVVNPVSHEMSNLPNNEMNVSMNRDAATTATGKEMFNVQILSVKSLNESDVIVLSDDDEEAVSIMNETKERVEEDSDVEIICFDLSIVREEKCSNGNITDDLNNEAQNKVNGAVKENSSSSSTQPLASVEQECIILDDLDLPSENTCTAKNIGMVPSSQLVDITNDEATNSSKNVEIGSDTESILKTLETIDINCIKEVLSATTATDTQTESTPAKADNSSGNIKVSESAPDSTPTKQKRNQNTCLPREQTAIDATVVPIRSFDVDSKINSQKTSAVETQEKHSKLVLNSNVLQNIKSGSEDVPSSKKLNSDKSSSNVCDKNSTVNIKSSTINAAPKSFVSKEIEIVAFSHKTEANALLDSQKNQQLVSTCTKMESYGNPTDELDIVAAQAIKDLNQTEKDSIVPLLELYRDEYEKFMNIKCTEQNVTAGLKLLEKKQVKKLHAISSSIKNVLKKDPCFHKINNEYGSKRNKLKSDSAEKNETVDAIKKPSDTSIGSYPDIEKDDKVKIFNQSVVKTASEYLKTDGPSSSQEVYNHLINSVCAECGKHAVAACSGCAKVYYCSENCGMTNWNKGHYETCKR